MQNFPVNMKIFVLSLMLTFPLFVNGQEGVRITPSTSATTTTTTPTTTPTTTTSQVTTTTDGNRSTATLTSSTTENTSTTVSTSNTTENTNSTTPTSNTPENTNSTTPTSNTPENTNSTTPTSNTPENTNSTTPTSNTPENTNSTTPTSNTPENTNSTTPTSNTPESTSSTTPTSITPENTNSTTPTSNTPESTSSTTPTRNATESTTPPAVALPKVQISETNIKTCKGNDSSCSWFIELSGPPNQSLTGLTLAVRNGAKNANEGTLLTTNLMNKLNEKGLYLLTGDSSPDLEQKLVDDLQVILLLLTYQSTELDHLMFATESEPNYDPEVKELYLTGGTIELIFSMKSFDTEKKVSLSRCKSGSKEGFVLVPATSGSVNKCDLDNIQDLQMKLTLTSPKCDSTNLPAAKNLKAPLISQILTGVNTRRLCGFTPFMLLDFEVLSQCKEKNVEIPVSFKVQAAFSDQKRAIVDGYTIFVQEENTIKLGQDSYNVVNCTKSCFKKAVPDDDNGGSNNKIKVTIAVVVSCIGVFLVILLFVIVYMKRKRRGILQFRMTRLDEDDDDLIGDMDDFVGNQGATFSNFK